MKIVHIITGLTDGGAEAAMYRLVTSGKINFEMIVISLMGPGKYGPLLEKAGVLVYCLNMPRGRPTIKGLLKLYQLLRIIRPDLVQTWMYHADLIGGVIARLAGLSSVVWGVHNTSLIRNRTSGKTFLIMKICSLLSYFVPNNIVCCAEASAIAHANYGYSSDRMTVIPNGYDFQIFQPNLDRRHQLRVEWGVSDSMPLLGMVGRLDPIKGHDIFFEACRLLRKQGLKFKVALIGEGLSCNNFMLMETIENFGLRDCIFLLGQRNDMPAHMSALDIHVLPSLSEAFPNVVVEAMACSTPCVVSDVGDAALIVGNAGWVVPPANPEALAEKIRCVLEIITDQDRWRSIQNAARSRAVLNFGIKKMKDNYEDLWRRVILKSQ